MAANADTAELTEATEDPDSPVEVGDDLAAATPTPPASSVRFAMVFGLATVVVLAALGGWLGVRAYQLNQAVQQQNLFLQAARQTAVNLTTIDWQEADADVQRILASATGTFHDDFAKRSGPFVDVVKQAKSKSTGTVTAAGIESETPTEAKVLVAVSVNTSSAGSTDTHPRAWRMRLSVQKVGTDVKVSDVAFVP